MNEGKCKGANLWRSCLACVLNVYMYVHTSLLLVCSNLKREEDTFDSTGGTKKTLYFLARVYGQTGD